jgi:hypothetical protein
MLGRDTECRTCTYAPVLGFDLEAWLRPGRTRRNVPVGLAPRYGRPRLRHVSRRGPVWARGRGIAPYAGRYSAAVTRQTRGYALASLLLATDGRQLLSVGAFSAAALAPPAALGEPLGAGRRLGRLAALVRPRGGDRESHPDQRHRRPRPRLPRRHRSHGVRRGPAAGQRRHSPIDNPPLRPSHVSTVRVHSVCFSDHPMHNTTPLFDCIVPGSGQKTASISRLTPDVPTYGSGGAAQGFPITSPLGTLGPLYGCWVLRSIPRKKAAASGCSAERPEGAAESAAAPCPVFHRTECLDRS